MNRAPVAELAGALRRFKPYSAYKDSGIEWLGQVPAHWRVRRLKYLAALNPESIAENTDPALEIVYVDIGGVDSLGRIVEKQPLIFASAPSRARRLVKSGDVIVSTVRTYLRAIAAINALEPNLVVSTGFAVVRPVDDLSAGYAAHVLRAPYFVELVVANSTGVSFPAINESEMATFALTLPAPQEQSQIAAFLERETARIDALVAEKERLIDLLNEQRASLITRAVTKGLDPSVPMRDSGVEWLGEIPAQWDVKRLIDCTDSSVPIVYGILLPGPRLDEGVPYIGAGDVVQGRLRLADLPRTTPEISAQYPRSVVRAGELVYAIRGSYGSVEIVPSELDGVNLSRDAARIAPAAGFPASWLRWALRSQSSQAQFGFREMGSAVTGVNIRDLKRVVLPLPPRDERDEIAVFLDRASARLDGLAARVREGLECLKEYRIALISAAVTGKIDVREEVA